MAVSNSHITILTLNVNGLNAPMKKTQTGKLDKKSKPISVAVSRKPITHTRIHKGSKGWRKIYQANGE